MVWSVACATNPPIRVEGYITPATEKAGTIPNTMNDYEEAIANYPDANLITKRASREAFDTLQMLHYYGRAYENLSDEKREGVESDERHWMGFDANNGNDSPDDLSDDAGHFYFAAWMINEQGLWPERAGSELNSHSSGPLPRYRRMLSVWRALPQDQQYGLMRDDLLRLSRAANGQTS